jgi:hypothetical protein
MNGHVAWMMRKRGLKKCVVENTQRNKCKQEGEVEQGRTIDRMGEKTENKKEEGNKQKQEVGKEGKRRKEARKKK